MEAILDVTEHMLEEISSHISCAQRELNYAGARLARTIGYIHEREKVQEAWNLLEECHEKLTRDLLARM